MTEFAVGDRVYVTDPGLAQMRAIMRQATGREPEPNHHGTVDEIYEDGTLLINFDAGSAAPYPPDETYHLEVKQEN